MGYGLICVGSFLGCLDVINSAVEVDYCWFREFVVAVGVSRCFLVVWELLFCGFGYLFLGWYCYCSCLGCVVLFDLG